MDRVSFVMRVKDGQQDEYIRRHREVWPDVMAEHHRAGVTKMAIYMKGKDLFLYMEVENYAKAVRILSASTAVLRWEEYMAPIMDGSGNEAFDPANPYPASLPEVYFWEPAETLTEARKPRTDGADSHAASAPHIVLPRGWSSVKS
jgi:L-rhamnose mutarotase